MERVDFEHTKKPVRLTIECIGYYENVDEMVTSIVDLLDMEGGVSVRVQCEEFNPAVVVPPAKVA
jgi:hypothetical protein